MTSLDQSQETRLNVRISGPLADHVNRQVDSDLYSSHSEYIRDLIRRDMEQGIQHQIEGLKQGYDQIAKGDYRKWNGAESLAEAEAYHANRMKNKNDNA